MTFSMKRWKSSGVPLAKLSTITAALLLRSSKKSLMLGCSVSDDNLIGEDLDSALRSLQNLTAKVKFQTGAVIVWLYPPVSMKLAKLLTVCTCCLCADMHLCSFGSQISGQQCMMWSHRLDRSLSGLRWLMTSFATSLSKWACPKHWRCLRQSGKALHVHSSFALPTLLLL